MSLKIFITVLALTLASHSLMIGQITYTFTNAGATGRFGPTQAQLNTAYASTNLNGAVTSNSGIQTWTVPYTGTYTLTAAGASGGSSSFGPAGSGIKVQSVVSLIAGQVLNIVIGQQGQGNGSTSQFYNGGSGGGGSFIYTGAIGSTGLILSAGGGGGALSSNANVISSNISDASFSTNGNSVTDAGSYIAAGGTGGNGGGFSNRTDFYAAGGPGTGWVSDYNATYGSSAPTLGGTRFNGGIFTTSGQEGGFGGGGASGSNGNNGYVWAGGGGGYSGGGGGHNGGNSDGQVGGGGGSFLTGTNQLNLGINSGDGYVIISVNDAQALNFDGTNDYVSVPHNTSLNFGTGDFSVEAYFKSSVSQPNYAGIVCKQNSSGSGGFQFVLYNNKIAAEISDVSLFLGVGNGLIGTTSLNDGNYHHVAMVVTRSQNKIELYVDGNVEATVTNPGLSALNVNYATALLIGVERTFVSRVNGNIDEVRLWNVARTKCDINTYKNCEIPSTSTGLVANYHFNQGIDAGSNPGVTSLTDASGFNNNGALTNFALTGTTSNWISPGGVISGSTTPAPAPVITASPSSTTICNSQSAVLTGGGAVTYTWSGGVANATAFNPTTTASYTVTGTASTGCTNSAVATVSVNNCTPAAALNFDGVDDDVRATGFTNFTEYTIEGWFKLNSLANQNLVVGTGNGNPNTWYTNQLQLSGGKFTHYLYDGAVQTVSSSIIPSVGVWYHVAIVAKNGTPVSIYVNGTQSVSASTVGSMSGANEYRLGGTASGVLAAFNGNMDEVRIWNVARTQCQINTYMNCEIPTTATGLLANYHFNQGFDAVVNSVTTLTNAASASYNGTLYNF
ncbi:MAG: LamG domain-containing protein, partial [Bacteroidia bacterium]